MDAPQPFRVDISRPSVELTIRETAVLPFCGIGSARIGIYWYHAGIRVQTVFGCGGKNPFRFTLAPRNATTAFRLLCRVRRARDYYFNYYSTRTLKVLGTFMTGKPVSPLQVVLTAVTPRFPRRVKTRTGDRDYCKRRVFIKYIV